MIDPFTLPELIRILGVLPSAYQSLDKQYLRARACALVLVCAVCMYTRKVVDYKFKTIQTSSKKDTQTDKKTDTQTEKKIYTDRRTDLVQVAHFAVGVRPPHAVLRSARARRTREVFAAVRPPSRLAQSLLHLACDVHTCASKFEIV